MFTSQKFLLIIFRGGFIHNSYWMFSWSIEKIPINYLLFISLMIFELYILLALCCFCNKKYNLSNIGILIGSSIGLLIYSHIITMDYSYFCGMICCFIFDLISFGIFGLCFVNGYIL